MTSLESYHLEKDNSEKNNYYEHLTNWTSGEEKRTNTNERKVWKVNADNGHVWKGTFVT